MTLWYANNSGPRYADKGKFHRRPKTGIAPLESEVHRGWSYQFTTHQIGTSVRRKTYSATIFDTDGHRVEHLRGFSSLEQAGTAAREWIDRILAKINKRVQVTPLGNIPKLPNAALNRDRPDNQ